MAEAALKIPAVSHVGRLPGGGDFGLKQRKHAVTGVRIANAIPYVAMAPPYTNGTFASIAASFSKNRVSRLSVPSTTMSASRRRSRTIAEWTSFESGSSSICEFTARRRCFPRPPNRSRRLVPGRALAGPLHQSRGGLPVDDIDWVKAHVTKGRPTYGLSPLRQYVPRGRSAAIGATR